MIWPWGFEGDYVDDDGEDDDDDDGDDDGDGNDCDERTSAVSSANFRGSSATRASV